MFTIEDKVIESDFFKKYFNYLFADSLCVGKAGYTLGVLDNEKGREQLRMRITDSRNYFRLT